MLELNKGDDLKGMQSIFYYYSTKGLIEVDATIVRLNEDILRILQLSES